MFPDGMFFSFTILTVACNYPFIYFSHLIFLLGMSLRALWGMYPLCFVHRWSWTRKLLSKPCCVADLVATEGAKWLYHSLCPQGSSDLLSLFLFSSIIPVYTQNMLQEMKTKQKTLGSCHWSVYSFNRLYFSSIGPISLLCQNPWNEPRLWKEILEDSI